LTDRVQEPAHPKMPHTARQKTSLLRTKKYRRAILVAVVRLYCRAVKPGPVSKDAGMIARTQRMSKNFRPDE
jgi:hypothetical protein